MASCAAREACCVRGSLGVWLVEHLGGIVITVAQILTALIVGFALPVGLALRFSGYGDDANLLIYVGSIAWGAVVLTAVGALLCAWRERLVAAAEAEAEAAAAAATAATVAAALP